MKIDGRFWLTKKGENFLGSGRIELLKRIEQSGSINAAAKEMKMSYKAAWERINQMNALADEPLIERQTGGKGGGGTKLTPYAHELIATYERFSELHRQFIERFSQAGDSPEHLAKILNRVFLTTSARNQLLCKITNISYNNLNALITMQLSSAIKLTSSITSKSMQSMNLSVGDDIYAIIKSSDVKIVTTPPKNVEATNIIPATIESIERNEESSEVTLSIDERHRLVALTPLEESETLTIHQNLFALVSFKSIIIGS